MAIASLQCFIDSVFLGILVLLSCQHLSCKRGGLFVLDLLTCHVPNPNAGISAPVFNLNVVLE